MHLGPQRCAPSSAHFLSFETDRSVDGPRCDHWARDVLRRRVVISARLQPRDANLRGEEATPIRLICTEVSVLADVVLTIWGFLHAIRWDGEVVRRVSIAPIGPGPY